MLEGRLDLVQVFFRDLIDIDTVGGKGPRDDLPRVIQNDDFSFVRWFEDIGKSPDLLINQVGVHNNTDRARHKGNAELVARIKWHVQKLRRDVFEIRNFCVIDRMQNLLLGECLDDILAGLDDVVFPAASGKLGEHLLV